MPPKMSSKQVSNTQLLWFQPRGKLQASKTVPQKVMGRPDKKSTSHLKDFISLFIGWVLYTVLYKFATAKLTIIFENTLFPPPLLSLFTLFLLFYG
jgi:hypothetical protein